MSSSLHRHCFSVSSSHRHHIVLHEKMTLKKGRRSPQIKFAFTNAINIRHCRSIKPKTIITVELQWWTRVASRRGRLCGGYVAGRAKRWWEVVTGNSDFSQKGIETHKLGDSEDWRTIHQYRCLERGCSWLMWSGHTMRPLVHVVWFDITGSVALACGWTSFRFVGDVGRPSYSSCSRFKLISVASHIQAWLRPWV